MFVMTENDFRENIILKTTIELGWSRAGLGDPINLK